MRVPKDYKAMIARNEINDELILSCLYSIDDALKNNNCIQEERHRLYLEKTTLLSLYQPVCIHEHLQGLVYDHYVTSRDHNFSIDLLIEKGLSGLTGQMNRMTHNEKTLYTIDLYQEHLEKTYECIYVLGSYQYSIATCKEWAEASKLPKIPVTHALIPVILPKVPLTFVDTVVNMIKTKAFDDQRTKMAYQPSAGVDVKAYLKKVRTYNARCFLDHHLSLILLAMREEMEHDTKQRVMLLDDHVISTLQIYARMICDQKWHQLSAKIHFICDHLNHLDEQAYHRIDQELHDFETCKATSFQKETKAYVLTPANREYYKKCLTPYLGQSGMTSAKLVSFFVDFSYVIAHTNNIHEINTIMEKECASYYQDHNEEFAILSHKLEQVAPMKRP